MKSLFVVALVIFSLASPHELFAEPPVLGAILSLTGDGAKDGENIREGVQFAAERLGVKLIIEDDLSS